MTVAIVQHGHNSGNGGTPKVTLGSAPTVGNLLIAFFNVNTGNSSATIGTGWTQFEITTGGLIYGLYRYVQVGDLAALPAFATAGFSFWSGEAYEISGVSGTFATDVVQHESAKPAGTTSMTTTAMTTAANGEIGIIGFANYDDSGATATISAGWTLDESVMDATNYGAFGCASRSFPSSGSSVQATITFAHSFFPGYVALRLGPGAATETGTATLAFGGIGLAAAGSIIREETGTTALHFAGLSIVADGSDITAPIPPTPPPGTNKKLSVDPLTWNTPIVNPDGTPKPEFQQKWNKQNSVNGAVVSQDYIDGQDAANQTASQQYTRDYGATVLVSAKTYADTGDATTLSSSEAYTDAAVAGLGSGDVAGPASATDSHIAQFDGTTGKLLKDGGLSSASFDAAGAAAAAQAASLPLHGTADAALKWATARTLSFTGDATGTGSVDGSANVATALTLATSGVTAAAYGDSTHYPTFTVDAKGRLTLASSVAANAGTVTSVALTVPSRQSVSGSPITASGTLAITDNNQNANLVFAGPTSGLAAGPTFRSLVGADLPNPSATTLGGIQSAAAVTHQWVASISTAGVPALSQPAFTDISGTASTGQIPDLSATYLPLTGGAMSGGIAANDGSAATPGLWWNSASKRGFFNDTANSAIGVAIGGVQAANFNANGFTIAVPGGNASCDIKADAACNMRVSRYQTGAANPQYTMRKARGTIASPAIVTTNDVCGAIQFQAQNVTGPDAFTAGAQYSVNIVETSPGPTAMGMQHVWSAAAIGSTSLTELMRLDNAAGLQMFGANKVIDQNRTHIHRGYTIGTLPTTVTGGMIYCSDLGGGGALLQSDGTNWKRLGINSYEARSLATGAETLNTLTNANYVNYTATLTANVTVTLGTTNAYKGAVFIIRNKGTGAFTFAIVNGGAGAGTLVTFAASTAKEATCVYDGTNWVLMQDSLI